MRKSHKMESDSNNEEAAHGGRPGAGVADLGGYAAEDRVLLGRKGRSAAGIPQSGDVSALRG